MSNKLVVKQAPLKGWLGGPHSKQMVCNFNNVVCDMTIEQCGIRTITIVVSQSVATDKLLYMYYLLVTFLFLCDGQFFPIKAAFEDDVEITESFKKRELPSYQSADFLIGTGNILLDYSQVLRSDYLYTWQEIRDELDISYKTLLYCVSSLEMPVDMKCAFVTEAFIPLAELVQNNVSDFSLPNVDKGESKLSKYLVAVINRYGKDIFNAERIDLESFITMLTNNRNRIAHVKSRQGKQNLNGKESVYCICKLVLLYRVALLGIIGIPYDLYADKLTDKVRIIETW